MRSLKPSAICVSFSWSLFFGVLGANSLCLVFVSTWRKVVQLLYLVGSGPSAQTREQMQRITESLSEVDETDQDEDQMKIK